MAKKYVFVRMPNDTYNIYKVIKIKMESDLFKFTGKNIKMPMTKVFKAIASPEINENYIQVDMRNILKLARNKK